MQGAEAAVEPGQGSPDGFAVAQAGVEEQIPLRAGDPQPSLTQHPVEQLVAEGDFVVSRVRKAGVGQAWSSP